MIGFVGKFGVEGEIMTNRLNWVIYVTIEMWGVQRRDVGTEN